MSKKGIDFLIAVCLMPCRCGLHEKTFNSAQLRAHMQGHLISNCIILGCKSDIKKFDFLQFRLLPSISKVLFSYVSIETLYQFFRISFLLYSLFNPLTPAVTNLQHTKISIYFLCKSEINPLMPEFI